MSQKVYIAKGHNSEKKMHFKLSSLIVWITLWIVNTHSKFQVNIFSNNRDYKMSQFLHDDDDENDDAKAIAIPRVFSENSRAKNLENKTTIILENTR